MSETTIPQSQQIPTLREKFFRGVDATAGENMCWPWLGYVATSGYGAFYHGEKRVYAHRVAYEIFHGRAPGMLCVLHKCDNRICCNPHHMFLGTLADNIKDMVKKKRNARGDAHGRAKITQRVALRISAYYESGNYTQTEVANKFGVSHATVSRIINGKTRGLESLQTIRKLSVKYDHDTLRAAVAAFRAGEGNQTQIAKKFGLSSTLFSNTLNGKNPRFHESLSLPAPPKPPA